MKTAASSTQTPPARRLPRDLILIYLLKNILSLPLKRINPAVIIDNEISAAVRSIPSRATIRRIRTSRSAITPIIKSQCLSNPDSNNCGASTTASVSPALARPSSQALISAIICLCVILFSAVNLSFRASGSGSANTILANPCRSSRPSSRSITSPNRSTSSSRHRLPGAVTSRETLSVSSTRIP